MLFAKIFIYRYKYSKSKPNMLEYTNVLIMINKSEYISTKRNNNIDER